jgi:tRNA threonylcarbamoyladenosine biosynthesis protein TsaB
MAYILLIETSTELCSVALEKDGELISIKESDNNNSHSLNIALFIEQVLKEADIKPEKLDAVAIGKGPGSYTGLRIGVSSAKGLCYGLGIPLIAVDSLLTLAYNAKSNYALQSGATLCPMIDARRMEVYSAIYAENLSLIREVRADIVDENTYFDFYKDNNFYYFGNGAVKCREILSSSKNTHYLENVNISSRGMIKSAEEKFQKNDFENLAYFEPFYLKDFIAAKSKIKGLV